MWNAVTGSWLLVWCELIYLDHAEIYDYDKALVNVFDFDKTEPTKPFNFSGKMLGIDYNTQETRATRKMKPWRTTTAGPFVHILEFLIQNATQSTKWTRRTRATRPTKPKTTTTKRTKYRKTYSTFNRLRERYTKTWGHYGPKTTTTKDRHPSKKRHHHTMIRQGPEITRSRTTPTNGDYCEYEKSYCMRFRHSNKICARTAFYVYRVFDNFCNIAYVNCKEKYEVWRILTMGECPYLSPWNPGMRIYDEQAIKVLNVEYGDDFILDKFYFSDEWTESLNALKDLRRRNVKDFEDQAAEDKSFKNHALN